jgi:hypothetical protein
VVHFDRIEYTVHAQRRMVERSISEQAIAEVLLAPDQTYRDGDENVAEQVGAQNKPLRVVYTLQDEPFGVVVVRVVTVYRIQKLKRL